jgi:DNA-binding response OmpR family regulator
MMPVEHLNRANTRVLIVDDNHDQADSLGMLASLWGYEVEEAFDGPTALDKISAFRPDVIAIDLGLPTVSGLDLAKALRHEDRFKDVLLIAITGFTNLEPQCREVGFDHYLLKPFDPDSLRAILGSVSSDRNERHSASPLKQIA